MTTRNPDETEMFLDASAEAGTIDLVLRRGVASATLTLSPAQARALAQVLRDAAAYSQPRRLGPHGYPDGLGADCNRIDREAT